MLFNNDNFDIINLVGYDTFEDNNLNKNKEYDYKLYDIKEGFLRGNMFRGSYEPYKHYTYAKLEPKNKKEEIEFKMYALDFAINDLNLYLDLHPEDTQIFTKFKKYIEERKQLKQEYKSMLRTCLEDTTSDTYTWIKQWPWEEKYNV